MSIDFKMIANLESIKNVHCKFFSKSKQNHPASNIPKQSRFHTNGLYIPIRKWKEKDKKRRILIPFVGIGGKSSLMATASNRGPHAGSS